jgi:subtilisin family serine protease
VLIINVFVTKKYIFTSKYQQKIKYYKMRILQPIYIATFTLVAFGSINAQSLKSAKEDPKFFTAKKTPLTEKEFQRWSHLDLEKDSIPGMSVDKAYAQLLNSKKGVKVIVAVLDSGVDIEHDDLKNVVWTNKKEIAGNGIDDDKNGYIDDVHGWNFLGDSNDENLELVRMLKNKDDGSETYKRAAAAYEKKMSEIGELKQQIDFIMNAEKSVKEFLKKDVYTLEEVKAITSTDSGVNQGKMVLLSIAAQAGDGFLEEIKSFKDYVYDQLNFNLNKDFNGRKSVGDNVEDLKDKKYGNNIVFGPDKEDALHGTHVAGIIAQSRNNKIGGDGVADNVEIMAIRAVPNGDEYDKDIALGIRYAVDNGAKIINGSFGKDFSPHKEWVWEAIKYAESKDVLIVFAAGNDSKNVDVEPSYPADTMDKKIEIANNVITIGALNYEYGEKVVASFSNYGATNVDVFAPGMKIYATVPNNKFKYEQGTSMASPNAAGVAALIRSYYPNLKASQVKTIMMKSGTELGFEVEIGEKQEKIPFNKASVSGKIVNAFNALKMAEEMSKQTKKSPKL